MREKLKNKNYPAWIDDYSKAVKKFTFEHDSGSHMPFDAFLFYPLYFGVWMEKIYRAILIIERKKISKKVIVKSMPTYGALKFIFYTLVNMGAYLDFDRKKAKKIFDFFILAMAEISINSDLFCETKNILRTKKELVSILSRLERADNQSVKDSLSKLIGILAMYNHALYNDYSTEYGYSIDGPYEISKGGQIIIREYRDLRPLKLWPQTSSLPFKKIKIASFYKNIKFKMRYVTTHLITVANYQERLFGYAVEIDGKKEDRESVFKKITEKLARITSEMYINQKKMSFEKKKRLFLGQQAYELKALFDLAGINWLPDKKLLLAISGKKLRKGIIDIQFPTSKNEYEDYIGVTYLKKIYADQRSDS